jgi:acyl-coenzyme A synthetase/AMP-(fatty) acid ligase
MLTEENEIGELCIRGSSLALGYYNDSEKTKENFVQNPLQKAYPEIIYKTGDLVRTNDKNEIEYICRKDFQIKHLGYRIELGEIEIAANSIRNIRSVCAFYNYEKKEIVLLYEGNIPEDSVREKIKDKVPVYMVPGKIVNVKVMPMNANGKIDRMKIKENYGK